ncbi:MAG: hypothetical protein Q9187_006384 [Circinaria calcarea]
MIVAIIKIVITIRTPREDDSWLFAWSAVESAVGYVQDLLLMLLLPPAIIIACLVSYRAAYGKDTQKKKYSGTSAYPLRDTHNASPFKKLNENETTIHGGTTSLSTLEGEGITNAPDAIHVRHEYEVNPTEV